MLPPLLRLQLLRHGHQLRLGRRLLLGRERGQRRRRLLQLLLARPDLCERLLGRRQRALQLGRFDATPLACASVTTYSKAWIKDRSERRMASANNLETHRCSGLGGRLGVDLLRSASEQKMNLNLPGSRRWRLHETTSPRGRRRGCQRV